MTFNVSFIHEFRIGFGPVWRSLEKVSIEVWIKFNRGLILGLIDVSLKFGSGLDNDLFLTPL